MSIYEAGGTRGPSPVSTAALRAAGASIGQILDWLKTHTPTDYESELIAKEAASVLRTSALREEFNKCVPNSVAIPVVVGAPVTGGSAAKKGGRRRSKPQYKQPMMMAPMQQQPPAATLLMHAAPHGGSETNTTV